MALTLLASNNATSVLASSISATATTLSVNSGTGDLFPSPVSGTSYFKLTLVDAATGTLTEIVHVTAKSGDVFTIQRAQEGTTARIWSANDIAANMMTAGTLSVFAQKDFSLQIANNLSEIKAAGDSAVSAALSNLSVFNKKSFAANDFVRIPDISGGLILQWAKVKSNSSGVCSWAYPTQFPNSRLAAWGICHRTNVSGTDYPTISFDDVNDPTPLTLSTFNLRVNGAVGAYAAFVFVLGY